MILQRNPIKNEKISQQKLYMTGERIFSKYWNINIVAQERISIQQSYYSDIKKYVYRQTKSEGVYQH